MRISTHAFRRAIGTMALCLMSGCSSSGIAPSPPFGRFPSGVQSVPLAGVQRAHDTRFAPHPYLDSAKMTGDIEAFSDYIMGVVYLYNSQGDQVGQLTGLYTPTGMASDIKGNLRVANFFGNNIAVYAAGLKSPPTFISDPGQYPYDVDSFNNGAYLAVANAGSTSGGPGSVTIFKGSTVMDTVTDPNFFQLDYCAFDAAGDVFFDGLNQSDKFFVAEIANAISGGTTVQYFTTGNALDFPGGIQVTTSGQIAVLDEFAKTIYTYNPPSNGSLGNPVRAMMLRRARTPETFAFTKHMRDVIVTDGESEDNAFEYRYPEGGPPTRTFPPVGAGELLGTAIIPTQYPKNRRH